MDNNREIKWINCIKLLACFLVVIGHFLQSMTKSGILMSTKALIHFDAVIYTFHVYLFFVCSGYLYQKIRKIDSFKTYVANVKRKLVNLGVPYLAFSGLTYLMKILAAGDVNGKLEYSFWTCLFIHPLSPYWFLYALFICYLVIVPFRNMRSWFVYLLVLLLAMYFSRFFEIMVPPVRYFLNDGVYFIAGMGLVFVEETIRTNKHFMQVISFLLLALFFVWVLVAVRDENMMAYGKYAGWMLILGLSIIGILMNDRIFVSTNWMQEYFMPIYVMHTIFAAGFRIFFTKLGVTSACMHVIFGSVISFLGPVIMYSLLRKTNYGLLIIYPYKVRWKKER